MKRYLLDTNAMGDLINHRYGVPERVHKVRAAGSMIGTCEPVVAEVYYGVEKSLTRVINLPRLERALAKLKCWPLTREASEAYGKLMTRLVTTGNIIGQMDALIAAIAFTIPNCVVVTSDADLLRLDGLTVENWRAAPSASPPLTE